MEKNVSKEKKKFKIYLSKIKKSEKNLFTKLLYFYKKCHNFKFAKILRLQN